MKRKAILIESSNVVGLADLPGARVDVENWGRFLQSDLGGAWDSSEIRVLNKPFSTDLKKELDVSSDCYWYNPQILFSIVACELEKWQLHFNRMFSPVIVFSHLQISFFLELIDEALMGFHNAKRCLPVINGQSRTPAKVIRTH